LHTFTPDEPETLDKLAGYLEALGLEIAGNHQESHNRLKRMS
jgi:hypothetical protein